MYADLLFLTELINDCLILNIVRSLSGHQTSIKRLMAGSLIGATISTLLAMFYPDSPIVFNIIAGVFLCFVMVHVTFRPCLRSSAFSLFILTYAAAFIMGGLFDFLKRKTPCFPAPVIILFCYTIIKTGFYLISYIKKKGGKLCRISIEFNGRIKNFTALIDTGNLLFDKKRGLPVSIITAKEIPTDFESKEYCSIKFNSLGCSNGSLKIIYVPHMFIEYKGEKKLIKNAPLGLANNKLSASDSYQMIISPDIINKMEI